VKTLDTLVADIYDLFDKGIKYDPALFEEFGINMKDLMGERFEPREAKAGYLRMSNIGRPDRQLWYDVNYKGEKEPFPPATLVKFAYGDLIEQMILLYAKMAGHDVQLEQAEVEVNGIKGHIDARIDGVVVDVKSASSYSWQKFDSGDLLKAGNDPFGYVAQLSGYVEALTPGKSGALLAVDKTLGKITLLEVPAEHLAQYKVRDRIDYLKEMVKQPEPPNRCYPAVPDGKSGNMKLGVGCSYCSHKIHCWPGLKAYYYSNGPRYLTKVVREPKVSSEFPDKADF
jgi:hypothetical protein